MTFLQSKPWKRPDGLLATEVNREIIERVAEEGEGYAVAAGGEELAQVPPEIVASPTRTELINIAPLTPGVVAFFVAVSFNLA